MKIPDRLRHPISELAWRLAREVKSLRAELDQANADLAVAKCRERRWRRHAYIASRGNPDAEWRVDVQMASDDIADAPEVDRRNASPRSLP